MPYEWLQLLSEQEGRNIAGHLIRVSREKISMPYYLTVSIERSP